MKFEKQRRLDGKSFKLGVANARVHLHIVEQFDPRDRNAGLHGDDDRVHRAGQVWKLANARGNCLRNTIQSQLNFRNDAQRAFGADKQPGEVIARARFARAATGADQLAIGGHYGKTQDVLTHRAVTDRIGARCARRSHAADRGVRAGIDRKEQPGAFELDIELFTRDPSLNTAVEVTRVDFQYTIHLRQVDANSTVKRGNVSFERCANAKCDHRHTRGAAQANDRHNFLVRMRKDHDVRHAGVGQAFAVAVLFAHRMSGDCTIAVIAAKPVHDIGDDIGIGTDQRLRNHRGTFFRTAAGLHAAIARDARAYAPSRRSDAIAGRPCRG